MCSITAWDRDEVLVEAIKHSRRPAPPGRCAHRRGAFVRRCFRSTPQYAGADAEHPASVEYRIMVPRRANLEKSS